LKNEEIEKLTENMIELKLENEKHNDETDKLDSI